MTKLHKFYFFFWKLFMRTKGIKKGAFVTIRSTKKKRQIKGVISQLVGESVTKKEFGFDIYIDWLEPLRGNDSRFFSCGAYGYKGFLRNNIKFLK